MYLGSVGDNKLEACCAVCRQAGSTASPSGDVWQIRVTRTGARRPLDELAVKPLVAGTGFSGCCSREHLRHTKLLFSSPFILGFYFAFFVS